MSPEGQSADQIIANRAVDHSSWHFFQAMSWLDLAKRSQNPSALHYAAFELRYGIEYLLFELLVLANRGLTVDEYQKCIGEPNGMKKMLKSAKVNYEKRSQFTRILMELLPGAPPLRHWKLDDLFRYWGIASELLHFVGAHASTHCNERWFVKNLSRLEEVLKPIWTDSATTRGFGLISRDNMEPEVQRAWEEFAAGTLSEDDLKVRMRIAEPILRKRRGLK